MGESEPAVVIPFSFFTQKIVRAEQFVPVCACRKVATKRAVKLVVECF